MGIQAKFAAHVVLTGILIGGGMACTAWTAEPLGPLDPSLVRSYHFDMENQKHLQTPYVAKYERGAKILLYVASKHISADSTQEMREHPTLTTIADLFATFRPEVVIVEGIDTGAAMSPKTVFGKADECAESGYRSSCGESFFAINQARASGAHFVSGEPRHAELEKEMASSGFSIEDLLGFYMVRQIPQYKRQGQFNRVEFPSMADKQLRRFQQQLGTTAEFGFSQFLEWYNTHSPVPASPLDVVNSDTAPHGGPDATYIQRISNALTLIRDRMIVKRIADMLADHNRVLVIYGGSHLITEEPAIVQLIGQGTYFHTRTDPKAEVSQRATAPTEGEDDSVEDRATVR